MRHLFGCSRCQLEARLHSQLQSLQQARKGFRRAFSSPAPICQGTVFHAQRNIQPRQPSGRYSGRSNLNAQNNVAQHRGVQGPGQGQHAGQSGQGLHPEQVLDTLDQRNALDSSSRRHVPQEIFAKVVVLAKKCGPQESPLENAQTRKATAEAWRLLQDMAAHPYNVNTEFPLGNLYEFRKAFMTVLYRSGMYLRHGEWQDPALPKPSDVCRMIPIFRLDAAERSAEVMCALCDRLVYLQKTDQKTEYPELLHEIMKMWNALMFLKLRRDAGYAGLLGNNNALDWSYLPDIPTFLQRARVDRQAAGFRPTFGSLLYMFMPQQRSFAIRKQTGHDFPTAACVTLDALRDQDRMRLVDDQRKQSYEPFVALLDGILNTALRPPIPHGLAERIKGSPLGDEYAALAIRLGLGDPQGLTGARGGSQIVSHRVGRSVASPGGSQEPEPGLLQHEEQESAATSPMELSGIDLGAPPLPTSEQSTSSPEMDEFVRLRIFRLANAVRMKRIALAQQVKSEVFAMSASSQGAELPNRLFENLMLAFLQLAHPKLALEVWNHFTSVGRQPTVQTYTVMMRGSQELRDINAMEIFWKKMRNAGIQPDAHAWSTVIYGLLSGGKIDLGMRALDELTREWFAAARAKYEAEQKQQSIKTPAEVKPSQIIQAFDGDVDGVPRPSLVVMNTAISALGKKRDQLIPQVLSWGRQFGLEPDQVTYHVLLNLSLRHGRADEAMGLLKRMQERGMEADSTTWTILISALFEGRSLDGLSLEDQHTKVMNYIKTFEAATSAGIHQKGYALIIDRLLKLYNNITAASAVLHHMLSKNIQPSTHIFTILMASYFQRQPMPDFAAAEALWQHIQTSSENSTGKNQIALDSLFYDRMIEGYAVHHQTLGGVEPMLHFLQRMRQEKKRPSWRALTSAAQALAQRQDWYRLTEIVDEARQWIKEDEGQLIVGKQSFFQRDFWEFVVRTGILRNEGITSSEQVMRPRNERGQTPFVKRIEEAGVAEDL
jgi:pentatricopeptide repeat protein